MRYREFYRIAKKLSSVLRKGKGANVYLPAGMLTDKTIGIDVCVNKLRVYKHKDGRAVHYKLVIKEKFGDENEK